MLGSLDFLTEGVEHAPTEWIYRTLDHLRDIRRADVIIGGEDWQLAAAHDEADRATDALLLELSRRVADAA